MIASVKIWEDLLTNCGAKQPWDYMGTDERFDLERLASLAFRRGEKTGDLVTLFHKLPGTAKQHPDFELLLAVYEWLFVPYSLWPIDIAGLLRFIIPIVAANHCMDEQVRFLIQLLPEVPDKKAQLAVTEHEFDVQKGAYERFIKSAHKYNEIADALAENPALQAEWLSIKKQFNVTKYANRTGVIVRRMVQERNFRPDWNFKWSKKDDRFKLVFDAFCCRWDLYGMENDKPLLLKFTLNVTAYGTMMMVPRYWSLDGHRDIKWRALASSARGIQARSQDE